VWKYTGDYKGGLRFSHEAQMIPKGYPGAGNIIIFDNGRAPRGTYALEISPVTKQVVWAYEDGMNFFSKAKGALQRLKNGNTFISEDETGRVFEVSQDKEIVWEFIPNEKEQVRRAKRYSLDYCERFSTSSPER